MKEKTQGTYSLVDRATVLSALHGNAMNYRKTARELAEMDGRWVKLNEQTIRRWWREYEEDPDEVITTALKTASGDFAQIAADTVNTSIKLINRSVRQMDEDGKILNINEMKGLATVMGIIEDKRRLLLGQPTSISETKDNSINVADFYGAILGSVEKAVADGADRGRLSLQIQQQISEAELVEE